MDGLIKRLEAKGLMVVTMRTVAIDTEKEAKPDDLTHLFEFSPLDHFISLLAFPKHENVIRFKRDTKYHYL